MIAVWKLIIIMILQPNSHTQYNHINQKAACGELGFAEAMQL